MQTVRDACAISDCGITYDVVSRTMFTNLLLLNILWSLRWLITCSQIMIRLQPHPSLQPQCSLLTGLCAQESREHACQHLTSSEHRCLQSFLVITERSSPDAIMKEGVALDVLSKFRSCTGRCLNRQQFYFSLAKTERNFKNVIRHLSRSLTVNLTVFYCLTSCVRTLCSRQYKVGHTSLNKVLYLSLLDMCATTVFVYLSLFLCKSELQMGF